MQLKTDRLILRPLEEKDAADLFPVMNDPDVTANLLLPHPYPAEKVSAWIRSCHAAYEVCERYDLAVVRKDTGQVIGVCSLCKVSWEHLSAELVYWIGKPHWGQGFITEAARKVLEYGFLELGLERVCVGCFACNTASRRVIEKLGFIYEGTARGEYKKLGVRYDTLHFGMLREDITNASGD